MSWVREHSLSGVYAKSNASYEMRDEGPFNRCVRLWKATPEYLRSPWTYYTEFIEICLERGARFMTFSEALAGEYDADAINVILDHHIDYYPIETEIMLRWERSRGIVSNVFDYDDTGQRRLWTVRDLDIGFYRELERDGFEIGYHQNAVGLYRAGAGLPRSYSKTLSEREREEAKRIFARDVEALREHFNIRTFIPHGAGESNARLIKLPDGYEDTLEWVYNNRSRNRTVTPKLRWRSWSDSNGQQPQLIKVRAGALRVSIDNLHTFAWTMEPGLNHILIHPGRFGLDMPESLYDGLKPDPDRVSVTPEFRTEEFGPDQSLPLDLSEIARRVAPDAPDTGLAPTPEYRPRCRYVLTDDESLIPGILALGERVIPVVVVEEDIGDYERFKLVRGSQMRESASHSAAESLAKSATARALAPFHNTLVSDRPLACLERLRLPFSAVALRGIRVRTQRDVKYLFSLLDACRVGAPVRVRAPSDAPVRKLERMARKASDAADTERPYRIVPAGDWRGSVLEIGTG